MSEDDILFHNSFKPKFGCTDNLICPRIPGSINRSEAPWNQAGALSSEGRTIVLHKYDQPALVSDGTLTVFGDIPLLMCNAFSPQIR